jgi:hypothetical protein
MLIFNYHHYIDINIGDSDPIPSTLQHPAKMESAKRVASGNSWDHLPEEVISIITVKVTESLEALLEDFRSLRLCNKAMKRVCSNRTVVNHFNMENPYHSTVWGEGDLLNAYLQTND